MTARRSISAKEIWRESGLINFPYLTLTSADPRVFA